MPPRRGPKRRSSPLAETSDSPEGSNSLSPEKKPKLIQDEGKTDPASDSESSSDEFVRPPIISQKPKMESSADFDFSKIEQSIFSGITRLSDSDSSESDSEVDAQQSGIVPKEKLSKPSLWKLRRGENADVNLTSSEKLECEVENDSSSMDLLPSLPEVSTKGKTRNPVQGGRQTRATKKLAAADEGDRKLGLKRGKAVKDEPAISSASEALPSDPLHVPGRRRKLSLEKGKKPQNSSQTVEETKNSSQGKTSQCGKDVNSNVPSRKTRSGKGKEPASSSVAEEKPVLKGKKGIEMTAKSKGKKPTDVSTESREKRTNDISPEPNGKNAVFSTTESKGKKASANATESKGKRATDSATQSRGNKAENSKGKKATDRTKHNSKGLIVKNEVMKTESNDPQALNQLDVLQLLALGENLGMNKSDNPDISDSESESGGDDDWEEVETADAPPHSFPKEGVQITLEAPEIFRHRKRRNHQDEMRAEMNRAMNRVRRELQLLYHKVSLLGWLAHGMFVNRVLCSDELRGVALSLIPSDHCYPPPKAGKGYLESVVKWFGKTFCFSEGFEHIEDTKKNYVLSETLLSQFSRKCARSRKDLVLMFVSILRALDMECRLVISLQPMALKPQSHELLSIKAKTKANEESPKCEKEKESKPSTSNIKRTEEKRVTQTTKSVEIKSEPHSSKIVKPERKVSLSKAQRTETKSTPKSEVPEFRSPKKERSLRSDSGKRSYKEDSESSDVDDCPTNEKESKTKLDLTSKKKEDKDRLKAAAAKRVPASKRQSGRNFDKKVKIDTVYSDDSDSEDDFQPGPRRQSSQTRKSTSPVKKPARSRKVLSTDDEGTPKRGAVKKGCDYWAEVFMEGEEHWFCVDVPQGKVNCIKEIRAKATQPLTYVIAFNTNMTVKDVTKRYVPQYSQITVKQRVDTKWWDKALKRFKPRLTAREREEDSEMNMAQLDRPMPKSVAECKNHPLYVLKRHLLKFQAIYPPDAPTLGFVKNEPLYARQNVYTLHSREIWMKEAKVVRLGEEPYKIVKARPKYDKLSGKMITDLPLEVFGPWQVEDYVPPTAVDGVVPRNAYGNVELFKPTMLPGGCVHLQIPGLSRVAKKLRIDCAPAVVGFDYHSGGCHPTYDGFVVCEENVDKLLDAWNRDIDESAKRNQEKHEKRVYGNWRRLIKGLLIREHLKFRYDFAGEGNEDEPSQSSVNQKALESARITEAASMPALFPKLMARVHRGRRRGEASDVGASTSKKKGNTKKSETKTKKGRKKAESSEEEEEEEESWESTTTEDEGDMVLLSDEDSGSEFD